MIQDLAQPWAQPALGNPGRPSSCFICTMATQATPCLKVVGRGSLHPRAAVGLHLVPPPIPGGGETRSHAGWSTLKPSPDFAQTCRWGWKWPVLLICGQLLPTSVCREHQCLVRSLPIYCQSCVPTIFLPSSLEQIPRQTKKNLCTGWGREGGCHRTPHLLCVMQGASC